ncbi:hypothetical protein MZK49_10200 [Ensifer sesbaniae]|jgi:hypothetical protein|nr:hypothetical protein [Ensifer sesbaniae]MCK3777107.1 hypothetical protein [Ensifer sesbaniae]NRQ17209.1 hypothetical protein [Ensifer sesbaniae]
MTTQTLPKRRLGRSEFEITPGDIEDMLVATRAGSRSTRPALAEAA